MNRLRAAAAATFLLLASAAPITTEAQQPGKVYRIGILCPTQCVPTHPPHPLWEPLIQGLRDFGWIEGQNFSFEFRHALGRSERLANLAAELVGEKPDVIIAPSQTAAEALKNATRTIPIVFVGVGDPVYTGLVPSLARPGGNMTGLTITAGPEIPAKRLELLRQIVASASRIAVLSDPANEPRAAADFPTLEATAKSLGVEILRIDLREPDEIEAAVSSAAARGAAALLVLATPMMTAQAARIGEAAIRQRLPAMIYTDRLITGYVLSYGPSFGQIFRRAGYYVDRILRGAKPADVPVERPSTFELVVNLKTAKTIGLAIPQSVLLRADKVIQ